LLFEKQLLKLLNKT